MADYDIGMIRVFVLIYETGSVTATAERLFLSQPSVSYTLRRLRTTLGDPLFVRRNQRLEPTSVAEDLYPRLRQLLDSLDDLMGRSPHFVPELSSRRFRLKLTDVGVSGLVPSIMRRVRSQAPGVVLDVGVFASSTAVQDLRAGKTDAVICSTRLDAPDLLRETLFTQAYVGVAAPDHPRIGDAPTIEEFEAEHHIAVGAETGHRAVDLRVQELGIKRRIALVIPSFSGLPSILAGTELLSFAPSPVAYLQAAMGQLKVFDLPFDVPIGEVGLYTIRREIPSPDVDWLRSCIIEALQTGSRPLRLSEVRSTPAAAQPYPTPALALASDARA